MTRQFIILTLTTLLTCTLATPALASDFNEKQALLQNERNTIDIFDQCAPSVVYITNKVLRREWFSLNVYEIPQGTGSGFVWDKDGHIVTNYHVIHNANSISVTLSDGSVHEAKIIGAAPSKELAILKIDAPAESLQPLTLGQSANLRVGQKVLAIGNPFGLDQTLTTGIVSALGREINAMTGRTIHHVIQTDASINPGNSGGPLLDSHGRLIGINTAIISPSGSSAGLGFAVPVDTVKRVVPLLMKHGKLPRVGLGINTLPDSVAARFQITGVVIKTITKGGPADIAGLQGLSKNRRGQLLLGDVIVGLDNTEIRNLDDYAYFMESKAEGDEIKITFVRDEEMLETLATVTRIE